MIENVLGFEMIFGLIWANKCLYLLLYHFPKNYSLGISRRRDTQWWNVCSPADFRTRSNEKRTRHLGPALDPPSSHVRPIARDQRRTPLQHAAALGFSVFRVGFCTLKTTKWVGTQYQNLLDTNKWEANHPTLPLIIQLSGVLRSKFRYGRGFG